MNEFDQERVKEVVREKYGATEVFPVKVTEGRCGYWVTADIWVHREDVPAKEVVNEDL